jgi:uncharacterized protein (TIGR02186 family)
MSRRRANRDIPIGARRPFLFALALLMLTIGAVRPAAAQGLVADLTSHLIAITTGFTGGSVVLFGAVEGGGDIVVTVRGPDRETVVRRKSRVAGIWINTRGIAFADVPGYYAVLSSRPLDQVAPAPVRQLHELGVDNLKLVPAPIDAKARPEQINLFRTALIRNLQTSGLFGTTIGKVNFLGEKLFRATLDFPATVPVGTYLVQVFQIRNGEIVAGQTTPLVISQSGLEAEVNDFATKRALLYGVVAVIIAAMAGWVASILFRNR